MSEGDCLDWIFQKTTRDRYRSVRFSHAWNDKSPQEHRRDYSRGDSRAVEWSVRHGLPVEVNKCIRVRQSSLPDRCLPMKWSFSGGINTSVRVAGPEVLNFFHWLGAVVTNPMIIGNKWTPVRKVVDRAGAMVQIPKLCLCMVVDSQGLAGLFAGTPETAWDAASDLSRDLHILRKPHPFQTILSCAPAMYDELWTGGKCMYKLEPVLADDGELIIYAPHISEVCVAHGQVLLEVGYHCRDYFLKQWERFKHYPWVFWPIPQRVRPGNLRRWR